MVSVGTDVMWALVVQQQARRSSEAKNPRYGAGRVRSHGQHWRDVAREDAGDKYAFVSLAG